MIYNMRVNMYMYWFFPSCL